MAVNSSIDRKRDRQIVRWGLKPEIFKEDKCCDTPLEVIGAADSGPADESLKEIECFKCHKKGPYKTK